MVPNLDRVTALIVETAAEEVMPRFRMLEAYEVREKNPGELVTVVDVAVEKRLTSALIDLLPGALVVGEEAVAETPDLLDGLVTDDRYAWIIDPIDGTANFAEGRDTFAVMVALVRGQEILAGWIHDPCSGRTAVGERGAGACIDGVPQKISTTKTLSEMRGSLHGSRYGSVNLQERVKAARRTLNIVKSLHCAGHEYLRLLTGEMDFTFFTRTKPWDHIPGTLLHAEAGGYNRLLDGAPYRPSDYDASGILMAPSEATWQSLREVLTGETLEA